MNRPAELPQEFAPLTGSIAYVQTKTKTELSSSCPQCGGTPHPSGEWPDRFILLLNSDTTKGPFAFCRHCGYKWWPGKEEGKEITPEERERWRKEAERRSREEKEAAEARYTNVLAMLERDRIWEKYFENLLDNPGMAAAWMHRGIDITWAAVWSFGYNPNFRIYRGEETPPYFTPSLTIPIFPPHKTVPHNIHNRLLIPPTPAHKYHVQFSGLEPLPWMAFPEFGWDGQEQVIIAEGEIKSAVVAATLEDVNVQVVGVAGKNGWSYVLDQLPGGQRVYICMDPDAQDQAYKMARSIPGGARIIQTPEKIDDLITAGAIGKTDLRWLMRTARKID